MKHRDAPGANNPLNEPRFWKVDPGFALGVFHLGTPRHEILQIISKEHLDAESSSNSNLVYVLDMDAKLYFASESPNRLILIEVSDERVRFGTLKIMWDAPHNLFASVPSANTLWFDDLTPIVPALSPSSLPRNPTDQQLLDGGTLWMKDLGVGFGLTRGKITTLYLCDPADLPPIGHGEFTGAQRHLSERMQIASYRTPVAKTPAAERVVKVGLMMVAMLVIAFFGRRAWEEQKRWDNAAEVQGDVVSVWPPPPDPFPSKFQVTYRDQLGTPHELELKANDVYGTPQVGDKVTLRYLPESPGMALGPIKFRDLAFDRFVPYLLGTVAAYFALHVASGFVIAWLDKR